MAASVQVRPGRIEASLGRGTFHEGTLKGRLSLITAEGGTEVRAQGAFDKVDMGSFLTATGQGRWIQGPGQGQFQLEGTGRTPAEVVRHATGHANVTIKDGELIGIGLGDAIRRVEKRPLAGLAELEGRPHALRSGAGPGERRRGRRGHRRQPTDRAGPGDEPAGPDFPSRSGARSQSGRVAARRPARALPRRIVFDLTGRWQDVIVTPGCPFAHPALRRSQAAFRPHAAPRRPHHAAARDRSVTLVPRA